MQRKTPKNNSVSHDQSLLHAAVLRNDIIIVRSLLQKGVHVEQEDKEGRTPLSYAVDTGNIALVELLIDYGADPVKSTATSASPILMALKKNPFDKKLLDALAINHSVRMRIIETLRPEVNQIELLRLAYVFARQGDLVALRALPKDSILQFRDELGNNLAQLIERDGKFNIKQVLNFLAEMGLKIGVSEEEAAERATTNTKDILSSMDQLPKLKTKDISQYRKMDKKQKGASKGGWYAKGLPNYKSKGSQWLFKMASGYEGQQEFDSYQNIVNEVRAIREAYAGEVYKLFIPEHVAKTRLVSNAEENGPKYSVASKQIVGFRDLHDYNPSTQNNTQILAEKFGKEVTKVIILAILMGETDWKYENLGFSYDGDLNPLKFIKIDHGETFSMSRDGERFAATFSINKLYDPEYLSKTTGLNPAYFALENINQALIEISAVDLAAFKKITTQFESILAEYREKYGESVHHLIGKHENQIAITLTLIMKELQLHLETEPTRLPAEKRFLRT